LLRNGAEDQLARTDIGGSNRVLMSDILLIPLAEKYRYNHGRHGMSWNYVPIIDILGVISDSGGPNRDKPAFLGINKLYCDGSVAWKTAREFDVENFYYPMDYSGGYIWRGGTVYVYY